MSSTTSLRRARTGRHVSFFLTAARAITMLFFSWWVGNMTATASSPEVRERETTSSDVDVLDGDDCRSNDADHLTGWRQKVRVDPDTTTTTSSRICLTDPSRCMSRRMQRVCSKVFDSSLFIRMTCKEAWRCTREQVTQTRTRPCAL